MTDIFISYSRQDQAWVSKLAKAFDGLGYDVWWDTQLLAGEDFQHIIPAELEKARCVVVVWSKTSVTRKWVRSEATRADNRGVLIPVRCESAEIPMPLDLLHAEDMQGWNGKPEHPAFQKLLQAVTKHCPRSKISGDREPSPKDPTPHVFNRRWYFIRDSEPLPKKFPWLPALFLSAAVFGGGGYYWQVSGKSLVGASHAGDSSMQQTNPVKKESLAGQAPTAAPAPATPAAVVEPLPAPVTPTPEAQLQQTETWLGSTDKTQWAQAIEVLNPLADSGNSEAMRQLGVAYYLGQGVKASSSKGCSWYKQAADAGHEKAKETYAKLCR